MGGLEEPRDEALPRRGRALAPHVRQAQRHGRGVERSEAVHLLERVGAELVRRHYKGAARRQGAVGRVERAAFFRGCFLAGCGTRRRATREREREK